MTNYNHLNVFLFIFIPIFTVLIIGIIKFMNKKIEKLLIN